MTNDPTTNDPTSPAAIFAANARLAGLPEQYIEAAQQVFEQALPELLAHADPRTHWAPGRPAWRCANCGHANYRHDRQTERCPLLGTPPDDCERAQLRRDTDPYRPAREVD